MFSALLLLTPPEAGAPFPASLAGCGTRRIRRHAGMVNGAFGAISQSTLIITHTLVFPCDGAAERTCKEHWAVNC